MAHRIARHVRLSARAARPVRDETPPFLVLYINSICNLTCDHCLYWRNLNRRDDLSFAELEDLSRDLGPIENLNLSGGEPFIRGDFDRIVRMFVRNNGVKQVYVPTSGFFPDRVETAVSSVLEEEDLLLFACELSLDGTETYHNRFRGSSESFAKALETYDRLVEMQRSDPRLRIHAISTAHHENLEEIRALTDFLYDRCPAMDHHNLGLIRGDRKDPNLLAPPIEEYRQLSDYIRARWSDRQEGRFGAIVEPMLQWAKVRTLQEEKQVIPCRAGILAGVVYANGDVSVCELHEPIGNLRQATFREIWISPEAVELRRSIANAECWCTQEVFLWPSIVFQPRSLVRSLVAGRAWRHPRLPIVDDAPLVTES